MLKTAFNDGFRDGLKYFKVSNALMGSGYSAPTAPPNMTAMLAQAPGRAPSPAAPIAPQGNRSMVL